MATKRAWESFVEEEEEHGTQKTRLTARSLMTLTRPDLTPHESTNKVTAWHPDYLDVAYEDIEEWTDFNETNANDKFFRILQEEVSIKDPSLDDIFRALDTKYEIKKEEDVDRMFREQLRGILQHTFNSCAELLVETTGNPMAGKITVPWEKAMSKVSLPCYQGDTKHHKLPNWPIYMRAKSLPGMTPARDVVFVIGESARTKAWDPTSVHMEKAYKKDGKTHLGKVGMYCKYSKTSYAFTMTYVGVTVFRYFDIPGTDRYGVQQKTFPWCPSPPESDNEECEMSGFKAIFTVVLMSLDAQQREMRPRDQLRSLADWPRLGKYSDLVMP